MIIANIIRELHTEHEIYFFLTAYIEAVRYCDKLAFLPAQMSDLPLQGKEDLQARFDQLIIELDKASRRLDDKACVVIKEALAVLGTALTCLRLLHSKRRWTPPGVGKPSVTPWLLIPEVDSTSYASGPGAAS